MMVRSGRSERSIDPALPYANDPVAKFDASKAGNGRKTVRQTNMSATGARYARQHYQPSSASSVTR
jgi:hypothetical protein